MKKGSLIICCFLAIAALCLHSAMAGSFPVAHATIKSISIEKQYQAKCSHQSHGKAWYGPKRDEKEPAQKDADDHNKYNPGHSAAVVEVE